MSQQTLATGKDERLAEGNLLQRGLRRPEIGAFLGAFAIYILFAFIKPDIFPTLLGFSRVLDPASTIGIMAVSVSLLLIASEWNLSVGVLHGSCALISGMLAVKLGWNIWPSIWVSLIFAIAVGWLNGWLIIKTGLPSFIVTLASSFALRGANVGVTRLVVSQVRVEQIDVAAGFDLARKVFNTEIALFGIEFRTTIIWWLGILLISNWILFKTKYGSWIFATGGDRNAARRAGVPVNRVVVLLYIQTSIMAWLVGIMYMVRLRSAVSSQGIGQEFVYLISAVVGGTLIRGGYGSVIGSSIGALIFGMIRVGITFSGWDTDWYFTFLGLILLAAVVVNDYTRRRAENVSTAAAKKRTEEE